MSELSSYIIKLKDNCKLKISLGPVIVTHVIVNLLS
jgi:hypothetical protein